MKKYLPTIGAIVSTLVILVIIFAAADATGYTGLIINPVSFLKNKFGKQA